METKKEARPSLNWLGQAISGILLIVIVFTHMLINHFQAEGMLSASQVVAQVSNTTYFILEIAFVIVVTYHALAGIRVIIFDLNLSDAARRKISAAITMVGILTIIYGATIAFLIRSQTVL